MKQIDTFIKQWPRAVCLMLAGGLLGYVLWMFLPQQYTAVSRLSVSINYNQTGKLEDLQEDRLIGVAEDILHSDEVMEQIFQQSDYPDYQTFFDHTQTSRTNETWSLAIKGKDPEEIGRLSLLWLKTAHASLSAAHDHAIRAEAMQNRLEGLTRCIQDSTASAIPAGCPSDRNETMQQIGFYTEAIQEELSLSHGLSPALLVGPENDSRLEIRPASRNAAQDTFFGALAGLLAAFAIVWFGENGDRT